MSYPLELQRLRRIVASIYYLSEHARIIAGDAGLDIAALDMHGSPNTFWHNILLYAHNSGKLDALFGKLLEENPGRTDLVEAIAAFRLAVQKGDIPLVLELKLPRPGWYLWVGMLLLCLSFGLLLFSAVDQRTLIPGKTLLSLLLIVLPSACAAFLIGSYLRERRQQFFWRTPKEPIRFGLLTALFSLLLVGGIAFVVLKLRVDAVQIARNVGVEETDFTIAVTNFCLDAEIAGVDRDIRISLQNSLIDFPQTMIAELGSSLMTSIGPKQIWLDCNALRAQIELDVRKHRLDVLVYGKIVPSEFADQYWVEPVFVVVSEPILQRASEVLETDVLGERIAFRPRSDLSNVAAELRARAQILNTLMTGLTYFSRGDYLASADIFCLGAEEWEASERQGLRKMVELLYLYCGNASAGIAYSSGNNTALTDLYQKSMSAYQKILDSYDAGHFRAKSSLAALNLALYGHAPLAPETFCARDTKMLDDAEQLISELRRPEEQAAIPINTQLSAEKAWADINFYRGFCAPDNARRFAFWTQSHDAYTTVLVQAMEKLEGSNLGLPFQMEINLGHGQLSLFIYLFEDYDPPFQIPADFYLQPGEGLQDASARFEEGAKLLLRVMATNDAPRAERLGINSMVTLLYVFCENGQTEFAQQYLHDFTQMLDQPYTVERAFLDIIEQNDPALKEKCGL